MSHSTTHTINALEQSSRIGDPTYADAILDRLVHNAHRIELTGDSLRKRRKAEPAAASVAAVPRARS